MIEIKTAYIPTMDTLVMLHFGTSLRHEGQNCNLCLILVCTAPVEDEQNFINPLMLTKHAKQTSEVIEDAESNKMVGLIREDPESEEDDDDDDEDMSDELSGELFQYQADDDAWNSIELNNTLDSDDYYDYNNITRLLEDDDDVNMIPSFRSIQDAVTPSLYTKENPEEPFELTTVNGRDSPISINHPTKVIVHGWLENGGKMWLLRMKDKYLINGNHNVITLDWEKWATTEYTISARKTRKIGAYLGQVLMTLIASEKIRPEDIHITGHSLGAHVAGIAAKTIKAQTGHKIGRITGLDPAGPGFEFPLKAKASKRLDKNDAMFVDVIHTCSGILGVKRQYGHADFYPNDGKNIQPGCGVIKNSK